MMCRQRSHEFLIFPASHISSLPINYFTVLYHRCISCKWNWVLHHLFKNFTLCWQFVVSDVSIYFCKCRLFILTWMTYFKYSQSTEGLCRHYFFNLISNKSIDRLWIWLRNQRWLIWVTTKGFSIQLRVQAILWPFFLKEFIL